MREGCQAWGVQQPVATSNGSDNRSATSPVHRAIADPGSRARLADRIADALSQRLGLPAWLDEIVVNTRIAHAVELREVVEDAARVARAVPGAALVWRLEAATGLVVRLNGPGWSLLFRICGDEDIPVLVLRDSMPGYAWRIDADDDWTPELLDMVNAVIDEIERRQDAQRG